LPRIILAQGKLVIGLIRVALFGTTKILAPLLQRDPEVYEARVVQRWARKYITYSILSKNEIDYDKKMSYMAKALSARAALRHVPVSPKIIEELDIAVSFSTPRPESAHGKSE
jgi:hypothetical protein